MEAWMFWMLFGFGMWMLMSRGGSCGRSGGSRRRRYREASGEVERLKAELDFSQQQIASLKARLEAVETIVTDEDLALRREFAAMERERPA